MNDHGGFKIYLYIYVIVVVLLLSLFSSLEAQDGFDANQESDSGSLQGIRQSNRASQLEYNSYNQDHSDQQVYGNGYVNQGGQGFQRRIQYSGQPSGFGFQNWNRGGGRRLGAETRDNRRRRNGALGSRSNYGGSFGQGYGQGGFNSLRRRSRYGGDGSGQDSYGGQEYSGRNWGNSEQFVRGGSRYEGMGDVQSRWNRNGGDYGSEDSESGSFRREGGRRGGWQ